MSMLFYFLVIRRNNNQASACIGHIAILIPNKPHHHAVEILSGTHLKVEKTLILPEIRLITL